MALRDMETLSEPARGWALRPASRLLTKPEILKHWKWLCEQFGEEVVQEALDNAPSSNGINTPLDNFSKAEP